MTSLRRPPVQREQAAACAHGEGPGRRRVSTLARAACAAVALASAGGAAAQSIAAVEYYDAAFDHYFITASADEIAALDGGAFGGAWRRTGQTFGVFAGPRADLAPVCRFFSAAFAPRSSHFYTPFAAECAAVRANAVWQFESIAFYLALPDAQGACPAGSMPLYRLYNGGLGGAPNHRYTTNLSIAGVMKAAGWTLEGGADGTFACAAAGAAAAAAGLWSGRIQWPQTDETGTRDSNVELVVLDTGDYHVLYTFPGSDTVAGAVLGRASDGGSPFAWHDARDVLVGIRSSGAAVDGVYTPRGAMTAVVSLGTPPVTPSDGIVYADFSARSDVPADTAAAAGRYTGALGSAASWWQTFALTFTADGAIAGTAADCAFTGVAVPHGRSAVFDVTLTFGPNCAAATGQLTGIALFDASRGELRMSAPDAANVDGIVLVGRR